MLWMNWVIFYNWNILDIPSQLILNCMKKLGLNSKIKFASHEENIMTLWKGGQPENSKIWVHFFPSKDNFCFSDNWKEGKFSRCILFYQMSVFKRLKHWYRFASPGDVSFLTVFLMQNKCIHWSSCECTAFVMAHFYEKASDSLNCDWNNKV